MDNVKAQEVTACSRNLGFNVQICTRVTKLESVSKVITSTLSLTVILISYSLTLRDVLSERSLVLIIVSVLVGTQ